MQYLVILGALVYLLGAAEYVRDTLRGKTKPNRVTFALWSLEPFIAGAAALSDGVTWAVVPVIAVGLYPLVIFIASFFNSQAYWKLGKLDWLCGAISLLAMILWAVTENPNVAILFAIVGDLCASAPTLIKSWTNPETETPSFYVTSVVCAATSFLAAETYSFAEVAFSTYIMALCSALAVLIYTGSLRAKRPCA